MINLNVNFFLPSDGGDDDDDDDDDDNNDDDEDDDDNNPRTDRDSVLLGHVTLCQWVIESRRCETAYCRLQRQKLFF